MNQEKAIGLYVQMNFKQGGKKSNRVDGLVKGVIYGINRGRFNGVKEVKGDKVWKIMDKVVRKEI